MAGRVKWVMLVVVVAGCQAPRGPVSLTSDDPDLRIQAIQRTTVKRRPADLPKLVADLSDDDSAVRFYSIGALRRLTGEDFGYHFYQNADERGPAVARWKRWLARRG